jgi:hypothetical protein
MPAGRGLAELMSRRGREPHGRRPWSWVVRKHGLDARADVGTTNSGGERSSREDEPVFFIEDGGRYRRKTIMVRPKWRGIGGSGVTQKRRYDDTNNTL